MKRPKNLDEEVILDAITFRIDRDGAAPLRVVAEELHKRLEGYDEAFRFHVNNFARKLPELGFQTVTLRDYYKDESGRTVNFSGGMSLSAAKIAYREREELDSYMETRVTKKEIVKYDVSELFS